MSYYIVTIEQIKTDEKLSEYGKVEKVDDYSTALSKFYTKLANVSADLDKNHTYMHIQIVNSEGYENKSETLGAYVKE